MKDQLKIPSDLEDDDDDIEAEGKLDDENDEFDQFKDEIADDFENEGNIFKQANDNDEMELDKYKGEDDFANKDMLSRINKLEDQMMSGKSWHMQGEI